MSVRKVVQRVRGGPALALFNSAKLALGDAADLTLRDACVFAELANGCAVTEVVVGAALLGLVQLERVYRLQEDSTPNEYQDRASPTYFCYSGSSFNSGKTSVGKPAALSCSDSFRIAANR